MAWAEPIIPGVDQDEDEGTPGQFLGQPQASTLSCKENSQQGQNTGQGDVYFSRVLLLPWACQPKGHAVMLGMVTGNPARFLSRKVQCGHAQAASQSFSQRSRLMKRLRLVTPG